MFEKESRLPLLIGAMIAVLLHVALVPVWAVGLAGSLSKRASVPPEQDRPLPTPTEVEAGRAGATVTNLAWISYEDYEELMAEHSIVEQPVLQMQQDPVPDAPMEMDPTPPAPNAVTDEPLGTPSPERPEPTDGMQLPMPVSREIPAELPKPVEGGEVPYAEPGEVKQDAVAVIPDAPDELLNAESSQAVTTQGSPDSQARPTGAPRSDRESPPVTIIPGITELRPGQVLVADGIEIKTVLPRPSNIARRSTLPRNPEATLTFNNKGEVINVELTKSTGADNWDSPVITSLLKWTATGELIENMQGELRFKVKLLLTGSE